MVRLVVTAAAMTCLCGELAHGDVAKEDMAKAATALFEQGRQLLEAGQPDAACDKFEASLRLDPQIGTKLNVAACREDKGRLLDAYRLFEEAGEEAVRTNKVGRDTFARQRMDKLLPRLVRITLQITPTPGLSIQLGTRRETRTLVTSELIKPVLIEPGSFFVTVSAPGRVSVRIERTGAPGAEVVIAVPALAPVAGEGTVTNDPPPTIIDDATPHPAIANHPSNVPALICVAGGSAALLGSVILGLRAKSNYDRGVDLVDDAKVRDAQHQADIATGVAVVGVAAVTVGVVLYLRNRPHHTVVPTATSSSVGVSVIGSF